MLLEVDADRAERAEVEVEHVLRRRLEDHLVLEVLLEAERVLAVAAVGRADARLDVRGLPRIGPRLRRNVAGFAVPAGSSVWYGCMIAQPCAPQYACSAAIMSW